MANTCAWCPQVTEANAWLCPQCTQLKVCPPFRHSYHGTATPGTWECDRCKVTLVSQALTTTPVAAQGPVLPWDC